MASIEERKNTAGKVTSVRVIWRDKKGGKQYLKVSNRADAEKWKHLLEAAGHDVKAAERALLRSISESPTMYTVSDKHLERILVRPYTLKKYRGYIRNHLDTLGNLPIDTVTDTDLIQWVKYMMGKNKSPKTISNVHGFIYAVFETAVALKFRGDNPCHGKYLPENTSTEDKSTFLTMDEFNTILKYVPEHNRIGFAFLISTGLRLGEMTALTVEDPRLDAAVPGVRVVKSFQEVEDGWVVGPPKTEESRRTVSLPPSTVAALEERIEGKGPDDQLFTGRANTVGPSHRTWQRTWNDAVAKARKHDGLRKKPRIHDLRHSHASLMIEAGMNLFDLAKRLGHRSVKTTTEVYGHLMPGAHFKAANLMEQILGGGSAGELN